MYKHLMIISDAEIQENSLHLTDRARAERLIEWVKREERSDEIRDEAERAMHEADLETAQADYPEGLRPRLMNPEDYIDTIRDVLAENDVDLYLDELGAVSTV